MPTPGQQGQLAVGYDYDTFASDLKILIDKLDLSNVVPAPRLAK